MQTPDTEKLFTGWELDLDWIEFERRTEEWIKSNLDDFCKSIKRVDRAKGVVSVKKNK